jgi:ubiquitin carboxyl-terminal hydrolase 25/28
MVLLLFTDHSKRIFEILGFTEAQDGLRAPTTDISSPQGRSNRRKLLRAWVELGSWIFDFKRAHGGFTHLCHRNLHLRG